MNLTMCDSVIIIGGAFGLAGSLILAYSLNPALSWFRIHLGLIDTTIQSYVSGGDVPVFTEMEKHHERSFKSATCRVRLGGWFLAIGFLAQVIAAIFW